MRSPSTSWLQSDMSSVVEVDGGSSCTAMSLSGLDSAKVNHCLGWGDWMNAHASLHNPHYGMLLREPAFGSQLTGTSCGYPSVDDCPNSSECLIAHG